ncbi:hypothetical protein BKA62DRAFT_282471 [Auriculariales sp. MPI-PUGE-AT-0066]|nr:hypothetical protein BKA62DRAFT_282471 [Auriculariales sp. MPI-PUGE-AT-0066]
MLLRERLRAAKGKTFLDIVHDIHPDHDYLPAQAGNIQHRFQAPQTLRRQQSAISPPPPTASPPPLPLLPPVPFVPVNPGARHPNPLSLPNSVALSAFPPAFAHAPVRQSIPNPVHPFDLHSMSQTPASIDFPPAIPSPFSLPMSMPSPFNFNAHTSNPFLPAFPKTQSFFPSQQIFPPAPHLPSSQFAPSSMPASMPASMAGITGARIRQSDAAASYSVHFTSSTSATSKKVGRVKRKAKQRVQEISAVPFAGENEMEVEVKLESDEALQSPSIEELRMGTPATVQDQSRQKGDDVAYIEAMGSQPVNMAHATSLVGDLLAWGVTPAQMAAHLGMEKELVLRAAVQVRATKQHFDGTRTVAAMATNENLSAATFTAAEPTASETSSASAVAPEPNVQSTAGEVTRQQLLARQAVLDSMWKRKAVVVPVAPTSAPPILAPSVVTVAAPSLLQPVVPPEKGAHEEMEVDEQIDANAMAVDGVQAPTGAVTLAEVPTSSSGSSSKMDVLLDAQPDGPSDIGSILAAGMSTPATKLTAFAAKSKVDKIAELKARIAALERQKHSKTAPPTASATPPTRSSVGTPADTTNRGTPLPVVDPSAVSHFLEGLSLDIAVPTVTTSSTLEMSTLPTPTTVSTQYATFSKPPSRAPTPAFATPVFVLPAKRARPQAFDFEDANATPEVERPVLRHARSFAGLDAVAWSLIIDISDCEDDEDLDASTSSVAGLAAVSVAAEPARKTMLEKQEEAIARLRAEIAEAERRKASKAATARGG